MAKKTNLVILTVQPYNHQLHAGTNPHTEVSRSMDSDAPPQVHRWQSFPGNPPCAYHPQITPFSASAVVDHGLPLAK